ncbi:MAG: GNAT family N-acetyltransferase [Clostridia bacterium]|nr:GNAT family N-acetyltransferase [Clostridia bacterium]
MLRKITEYRDLDERKLMDVYSESNYENTDYFFPEETDKEKAVRQVEAGFLDFLKNDFFSKPEAAVWVYEESGTWFSALRTCRVRDVYFLEALETRPDQRKKGYAALLLSAVADALKKQGPFRLYDCVSKRNTASLKTHEKCGFRIVSEEGYDYLMEEADDHDYGLEYCYPDK